ncbi:MAG: CHRD domain-containing protein [Litorilinea sp.]|nr:MAG: CHRD domain-containing protein [Litorilinea sp.]
MNHRFWRFAILIALVVAAFSVPATALANKKVYKAALSTKNELHDVVDSNARGRGVFAIFADGQLHFQVQVRNLSGPVTGAHLHGPATAAQNAGVLVTLCGNPQPGVYATCETTDGVFSVDGVITSQLLAQLGLKPKDLMEYLDNGLVYINVHTAQNPAGEARGQLIPQ